MPASKRYKFPGSKFRVQIGLGAPVAITGITAANPPVLTAAAHGVDPGTPGKIADVVGMVELNGNLYVADAPTEGTLELVGVDATGYTAYGSGGTFAPATMSNFCELTNYNQQDGSADEYDATTICSTAKEFEVGLSDPGTMQLDYLLAPNSAIQSALRAAKRSGEIIALELEFPKDGGRVIALGSVQQQSMSGGNGSLHTGSATIRLTGDVIVLEAV